MTRTSSKARKKLNPKRRKGDKMPMVNGKKFAYTKKGKAAAKRAKAKMKRKKVAKKKAMKRGKNKAIARKRVVRNEAGVAPNPNY